MLTTRGWALAGAGLALLGSARAFAIVELAMLAAVCFAGVGLALALVSLRRPRLEAHRVLRPAKVEFGSPALAELTIHNPGPRATPSLVAGDAFAGGRMARFVVPAVSAAGHSGGAYRLPTDRRGVYQVGPLTVWSQDPFGLARRVCLSLGPVPLTVYPRVDRVPAPPLESGGSLFGGPARLARLPGGEEFAGLRKYEVGDDLKRVHWRSTARVGELMLRTGDSPRPAPVALLVDTRRRGYRGESFERAVEAAASVAVAVARSGRPLRFLDTTGAQIASIRGRSIEAAVMEHLAAVEPGPGTRFEESLRRLALRRNGGSLVVVAPPLADADAELIRRAASGFGVVVLVTLHDSQAERPSRASREGRARPAGPASALVVDVTPDTPFTVAWNRMVSRCRHRDTARR